MIGYKRVRVFVPIIGSCILLNLNKYDLGTNFLFVGLIWPLGTSFQFGGIGAPGYSTLWTRL